jgi:hypothetical protein
VSPPGPMTVLVRSVWSYWRQIHSLEASSGVSSSRARAAAGSETSGTAGGAWRASRSWGALTRVLLKKSPTRRGATVSLQDWQRKG